MRFPCSPQRRADFVLSHASVRGIKSFGMLLCVRLSVALSLACPPSWAALLTPPSPSPYRGTTTGHLPRRQRRRVEFVDPPAGSQPGDRVYFEGFADRAPLELLNPKKKIFETVQPGFTTLDNRDAAWVAGEGTTHRIVTERGVCAAPTYVGASLS